MATLARKIATIATGEKLQGNAENGLAVHAGPEQAFPGFTCSSQIMRLANSAYRFSCQQFSFQFHGRTG